MIDKFVEEYRFLSNFATAYIEYEGIVYKSVEHAYVAAKTISQAMRVEISAVPTAGQVKRFGKLLELRPDWEEVKLGIMEELVRKKFLIPDYTEKLLATGNQELVESNTWHDKIWGVCVCSDCDGKGENNLGKILMKIRTELQNPSFFS